MIVASTPSYYLMKSDIKNIATYTIISDPGVDDIIALLLLSKLSPKREHTLVSTFGNAPEEHTAQNAKEFVSLVAPHWFYANGPKHPVKPLAHAWPSYFHGADGVCGIHPTVNTTNIKTCKEFGKVRNTVSLGPMTGVYDIVRKGEIKNITIMGGAIHAPGNETTYAETNIAFDPEAAEYVFTHCRNTNVSVVPLDVTKQVFWTKDDINRIPEDNPHKTWIKKILFTWFENYGGKQESVFHLHDPLAIYSMYFPNDLEWRISGINVVTTGAERGRMVPNGANPPCKIASEVHNSSRIAQRIFEIVFSD